MKKSFRLAAAALPFVLVAAACGSDKKEEAAPATTAAAAEPAATEAPADPGAAGLEAAKAAVASLGAPPTKIGPTIKLTGKPEKKTVAWLECELPSCTAITPGFEAATKALGWDLKTIAVGSFSPQEAFQQALDQGADYVAITGTPAASLTDQIAAAKAKGVGFASCYEITDPDPAANILMQCGDDDNVTANGGILANWTIADSGGKAHVLMVNIPDFPVLVSEADGAKAAYAANCPGCKFDELNVTLDQLIAGEIPGAVVSKLQADPSINYLHFAFGDLPNGVLEAMTAAGLNGKVKLTGVDAATALGFQGVVDGTHAAWTTNPKPYAAWLMVDAFARHSLKMDNPEERANALLPTFIVADKATAEKVVAAGPNGWPGPEGMEDQFKALWGV